ncbi:hypothetical protein TNCV_4739571 [Trichonephila clavipes]|nr:hypothetical protein TNCV_4739571 [Trichonephila clavipes]
MHKAFAPIEIHHQLCQAYGLNIMSKQMERRWCRQFSEGRQSVHDEDGSPTARRTAAVLTEFGWELFDQSPIPLILLPTIFTLPCTSRNSCPPPNLDPDRGWRDLSYPVSLSNVAFSSELVDLDAFNRGKIVGAGRMGHSISGQTTRNFKVDSFKSIPRIHGWWKKASDRANYKGQLALIARSERRLSVLYIASKAKY